MRAQDEVIALSKRLAAIGQAITNAWLDTTLAEHDAYAFGQATVAREHAHAALADLEWALGALTDPLKSALDNQLAAQSAPAARSED